MTSQTDFNWDEGTCYVCSYECNPASQTCGICARNMTMSALGWDVQPRIHKDTFIEENQDQVQPEQSSQEEDKD